MNTWQTAAAIAIVALVTLLLRAFPFLVFRRREPPAFVRWLGGQLPRAVMAMLVLYCLKDIAEPVAPFHSPAVWPALLGTAVAAFVHLWKRQMMLSIAAGTAVYMALLRVLG